MSELSFDEQVERGEFQKAEQAVMRFYREMGLRVEDVTDAPKWRDEGVDFIIHGLGEISYLDVKLDHLAAKTGNFVFEMIEILWPPDDARKNKIGWGLKKNSAGIRVDIVFVCAVTHEWYRVPLAWLLEWVFKEARKGYASLSPKGYYTHGVLIPKEAISGFCVKPRLVF